MASRGTWRVELNTGIKGAAGRVLGMRAVRATQVLAEPSLPYNLILAPASTVGPGVWNPFTGSNRESKIFVPFR